MRERKLRYPARQNLTADTCNNRNTLTAKDCNLNTMPGVADDQNLATMEGVPA